MDRKFRTRPKGDRPVYPAKTVEVFNPLYVVEKKVGDTWIPTISVETDIERAKDMFDELDDTDVRLVLYKRISENG